MRQFMFIELSGYYSKCARAMPLDLDAAPGGANQR